MNDKQRHIQFARRAMVHSVVRRSIDSTARQAESATQRDASPSDNGENAIQSSVDQAGRIVENTAYTSRKISYTRFCAFRQSTPRITLPPMLHLHPGRCAARHSGAGAFVRWQSKKQKQPNRKPPRHPLLCLCKRRRYLLVKSSGGRF